MRGKVLEIDKINRVVTIDIGEVNPFKYRLADFIKDEYIYIGKCSFSVDEQNPHLITFIKSVKEDDTFGIDKFSSDKPKSEYSNLLCISLAIQYLELTKKEGTHPDQEIIKQVAKRFKEMSKDI